MKYNGGVLKRDEKAIMKLRELYELYGYKKYKMSKFEEYDLYLENKSFLTSDNIITFNDLSGRLLALKPDVTLSIVKNTAADSDNIQKLYYNENVYRTPHGSHEFREIMQVGLEYIGNIDLYAVCEVLALAAKSLELICGKYVIDVSHMGIVTGVLESVDLKLGTKERVLKCIEQKNPHELERICAAEGIGDDEIRLLTTLATLSGGFEKTLAAAKNLIVNDTVADAVAELESMYKILKATGNDKNINLDFSIINDLSYYNGIIFQGFIEGVPCGILSGGRYDRLLEKLGRRGGAIGFAIYTSLIDLYDVQTEEFDADALIIYNEETDIAALAVEVERLTESGERVFAARDGKTLLRSRKVYKMNGRELDLIETND